MTREHAMRVGLAAALSLLVTTAGTAQTLKEVEVRGVGDGTRIVLDVDGEVSHKSFTLSNPDRIVLDLIGASNAVRVNARTVPAGPVKDVRISQFAKQPQAVTRLVADLRQAAHFEVSRGGSKLVLAVSRDAAGAARGAVAVATPTDKPIAPHAIALTSQRGILREKIALIVAPASGNAGTSQSKLVKRINPCFQFLCVDKRERNRIWRLRIWIGSDDGPFHSHLLNAGRPGPNGRPAAAPPLRSKRYC